MCPWCTSVCMQRQSSPKHASFSSQTPGSCRVLEERNGFYSSSHQRKRLMTSENHAQEAGEARLHRCHRKRVSPLTRWTPAKKVIDQCANRTDHQSPLNDLDLPCTTDRLLTCMIQVNAAGWEPYNMHGLAHVSWVGSVLCRSCTASHNAR